MCFIFCTQRVFKIIRLLPLWHQSKPFQASAENGRKEQSKINAKNNRRRRYVAAIMSCTHCICYAFNNRPQWDSVFERAQTIRPKNHNVKKRASDKCAVSAANNFCTNYNYIFIQINAWKILEPQTHFTWPNQFFPDSQLLFRFDPQYDQVKYEMKNNWPQHIGICQTNKKQNMFLRWIDAFTTNQLISHLPRIRTNINCTTFCFNFWQKP